MVENRAIDLDKRKTVDAKLGFITPDAWRAMIGIHRTLLNEYHDFFIASQHPSASQSLRSLAKKYNMPARMRKHGIHTFLEILRQQLPYSREFMIQFIYHAYHVICLLLETVPAFKGTWVGCLENLSRYRMNIEDEDIEGKDTDNEDTDEDTNTEDANTEDADKGTEGADTEDENLEDKESHGSPP